MQRDFGTTFVTQCAPVMAGLKAANLFRWVEPDAGALAALLDAWRSQLGPPGRADRGARKAARAPTPT
mgnify:CR=1 FL=1